MAFLHSIITAGMTASAAALGSHRYKEGRTLCSTRKDWKIILVLILAHMFINMLHSQAHDVFRHFFAQKHRQGQDSSVTAEELRTHLLTLVGYQKQLGRSVIDDLTKHFHLI